MSPYCVWLQRNFLICCTKGLLSGKYNDGIIPPYTRFSIQDHPVINRLRAGFFSEEGRRKLEKIKMVCVSENMALCVCEK